MPKPTSRIVLAYSGDLGTSVAVPWLADRYQAEVVAVTLDLGQGAELTDVRERALAAGAVRAHVIDAREELVREYVVPALQAGALGDGRDPLGAALGHALIAKRLVDVARMESASAVAHGSDTVAGKVAGTFAGKVAGTDGTRVVPSRLDESLRALDPSLTVIAPVQIWGLSRAEQIEYARGRNMSVPGLERDGLGATANVWGRSVRCGSCPDAWTELPDSVYTLTRAARDCPDEAAYIDIEFDAGLPLRANGIDMPMLELIESLDIIGGAHGVGRTELLENRGTGNLRAAHEAPAAVLLHAAHTDLEAFVVPRDLERVKQGLAGVYADLVHAGRWFSPTREAIDAFVRSIQPRVTGSVRMKLFKGDCRVVGRRSPFAPGQDAPGAAASARLDQATAEGLIS